MKQEVKTDLGWPARVWRILQGYSPAGVKQWEESERKLHQERDFITGRKPRPKTE